MRRNVSLLALTTAAAAAAGAVRGRAHAHTAATTDATAGPPSDGPAGPPRSGGAGRLPRPVLWPDPEPAQRQPHAYDGTAEGQGASEASRRAAWVTVGLGLVGVVALAFAFVLRSWLLAAAALVPLAVAAVLAVKFDIMNEVSVSQSPDQVGGG